MAAPVLPFIVAFFLLAMNSIDAMNNEHSLPPLPKPPVLKKPEPKAPPLRNSMEVRESTPLRIKPFYAFGATAANSLDDVGCFGFVKNEHVTSPGNPLVNLKVGHCVIVPRSDQRFSYGFVTEIINPNTVCVACDKRKDNSYTIKIIAADKLFLDPTWLDNTLKDTSTLTSYTRSMKQMAPLPDNLQEEESYQRLPKSATKNVAKK